MIDLEFDTRGDVVVTKIRLDCYKNGYITYNYGRTLRRCQNELDMVLTFARHVVIIMIRPCVLTHI
jgi:hypothetical protein